MSTSNRLKTLVRTTATLLIMVAGNPAAHATSNSSTTACPTSVTVVAPIVITKTANMDFGNVVPDASTPGTVTLAPAGTRTSMTATVGTAGTTAAGAFTVTGLSGAAYTITLPSTDQMLTNGTPAEDMAVNTFTSDSTSVITGGSIAVHVGATLHLAAAQPAGAYTGSFNVTVTYN
jgi:hypothetical protein